MSETLAMPQPSQKMIAGSIMPSAPNATGTVTAAMWLMVKRDRHGGRHVGGIGDLLEVGALRQRQREEDAIDDEQRAGHRALPVVA